MAAAGGNPKMADVARLAGVSLTTVGRVLHNNGYVSGENRKRVEAAVKKLGYVPNTLAQSLKSGVQMIGHILQFSPNMLFAQISRAVDEACTRQGYSVLSFTKYGLPGEDERIVTEFIGRRMSGVILTSIGQFDPGLVKKLERAGIPLVWIERAPERSDRVLLDDRAGTYSATQTMLRAGHKKIAYIGLENGQAVEALRLEGYRQALAEAGLPLEKDFIKIVPDYHPASGCKAMQALWEQGRRPTAVFGAADTLIAGAMQYLYQAEVKIPTDISLMGYDNTISAMLSPPVDSVGIYAGEMGQKAVELLLKRRQELEGPPETVLVGTELVDRGTVVPPME